MPRLVAAPEPRLLTRFVQLTGRLRRAVLSRRGGVVGALVVLLSWWWWRRRIAAEKEKARREAAEARAARATPRGRWRSAMHSAKALATLKKLGMTRSKFARLSNGRVHYVLDGPEHGPFVVLFHGFGIFSFVWERLITRLVDDGFRVLAFDWYGFGFSEAAPGVTYTADTYTAQARELIQILGLPTKFTLLGHSMGGLLAVDYALRRPRDVERLVLVCPAGSPPDHSKSSLYARIVFFLAKCMTAPLIGHLVVETAVWFTRLQMEATLALSHPFSQKRNLSYGSLVTASSKLSRVSSRKELRDTGGRFMNMLDMTTKAMSFQAEHNPNYARTITEVYGNLDLLGDWTERFATVGRHHRPCLLMWGGQDEYVPIDNMRRHILPAMPRAEVAEFPEADHYIFFNEFDSFYERLQRFLSRAAPPLSVPPTPPKAKKLSRSRRSAGHSGKESSAGGIARHRRRRSPARPAVPLAAGSPPGEATAQDAISGSNALQGKVEVRGAKGVKGDAAQCDGAGEPAALA